MFFLIKQQHFTYKYYKWLHIKKVVDPTIRYITPDLKGQHHGKRKAIFFNIQRKNVLNHQFAQIVYIIRIIIELKYFVSKPTRAFFEL